MKYKQGKWNLDDLYTEDYKNSFQNDIELLKKKAKYFEKFRNELQPDISTDLFLKILQELESITELAHKIDGFTSLMSSADTQNNTIISLKMQSHAVTTEIFNKIMFFEIWFCKLENNEAISLINSAKEYSYFLTSLRLSKPYMLSENEEKIINIKDMNGSSALVNLYSTITNRYKYTIKVNHTEKEMTRGELMSYTHSSKREERKASYEELYRVYSKDSSILGQIYQNLVQNWDQENIGLRGYISPISARNLQNNIPDKVVDLLLNTCKKNKNVFNYYFKIKKSIIGLNEMHRYDLYAPIAIENKTVSFDDAYQIVLKSYNEFDPSFASMAERVYKEQHIDSEIRHGKRSGAFCSTIGPKYTPWVLINFQGKNEDISTLAHELGHAIHSMSAGDKNIFEQHACLPLAETASTFGEMLLSDYLAKQINDKNILLNILCKQIDDNYATIQRQAYFAIYEKKAHDMIAKGADINDLSTEYLLNLTEQFNDSMIVDEYFKWEWLSIPHIYHTPFYVYAYAFGQLLVLALYNQYKNEGNAFVPGYKEMLHKGGSEKPEEILLDAGFDFTKESFWQGGFDIIKEKIELITELSK